MQQISETIALLEAMQSGDSDCMTFLPSRAERDALAASIEVWKRIRDDLPVRKPCKICHDSGWKAGTYCQIDKVFLDGGPCECRHGVNLRGEAS